ncbi:chemotaxis protein CheX [Deltaproteobacteria bacterium]|nr:chemotaxis protein CheX [Deltaproteobacteria bacterium]
MRNIDIAIHFVKATTNILSTMAFLSATPGKPFAKKDQESGGDISAIIGVTGPKKGSIAVLFPTETAEALVRGMLGDSIEDLNQDMRDAVGELANMISGQARASLAETGLVLQGSTPSVVCGKGHQIHHITQATVMVIPFSMTEGSFHVEFCLE